MTKFLIFIASCYMTVGITSLNDYILSHELFQDLQ